mgnify:CR=1 FL=1
MEGWEPLLFVNAIGESFSDSVGPGLGIVLLIQFLLNIFYGVGLLVFWGN